MPRILRAVGDEIQTRFRRKETAPVNRYEGFTERGEIVLRDRRSTVKAEIPNVDLKAEEPRRRPASNLPPQRCQERRCREGMHSADCAGKPRDAGRRCCNAL